MLQDTIFCAGRKVIAWMSGNRHQPALVRMLELPMATACPVKMPAVSFDEFYSFANFHKIAVLQSGKPFQAFFRILSTIKMNSSEPIKVNKSS